MIPKMKSLAMASSDTQRSTIGVQPGMHLDIATIPQIGVNVQEHRYRKRRSSGALQGSIQGSIQVHSPARRCTREACSRFRPHPTIGRILTLSATLQKG